MTAVTPERADGVGRDVSWRRVWRRTLLPDLGLFLLVLALGLAVAVVAALV